MDEKHLDTLVELAFDEFEKYHDDIDVLSDDEKDIYAAGFLDALAWAIRHDHIMVTGFKVKPEDFEDPDETPEEREEFFKNRYEGLAPDQRAALEAVDQEDARYWTEYVTKTIKQNKALEAYAVRLIAGSI